MINERVDSSKIHLIKLLLRERVEVDFVDSSQCDHRDVLQIQFLIVRVAQRQLGSLDLEFGQIRHVLIDGENIRDRVEREILDRVGQHFVDHHVDFVLHHVRFPLPRLGTYTRCIGCICGA